MPSASEVSTLLLQPCSDEVVSKPKDQYRVVVMGSNRVGKTAIISQFLYDQFISEYKETVEELHRGEYDIAGIPLTLDLLDTSGAYYEFPAMRALSIASADAFVLVYSVDDPASFEEVRNIRELILQSKSSSVPMVIVGNKCDLSEDKRLVTQETAETIVTIDWENGYVETSAKNNVNIVAIFKELLHQANVTYALSPAVRRRRQSLPNNNNNNNNGLNTKSKKMLKRHSCVIS